MSFDQRQGREQLLTRFNTFAKAMFLTIFTLIFAFSFFSNEILAEEKNKEAKIKNAEEDNKEAEAKEASNAPAYVDHC